MSDTTEHPAITDEREQQLQRVAEHVAAIQQTFAAAMPALQALFAQLAQTAAEVTRALQSADLLDQDGKPTRRTDRPAWQTPYGPPTRRH